MNEFDVVGNTIGEYVNNADAMGLEYDYEEYRCNTTYARVTIMYSNDTHLSKYRDVDSDNKDEKAIDENNDLSDGYEVYEDPDNSSDSIKSIDGDNDNQIDHFIDNYDGTYEWVYDSDDDFYKEPDKYYDPNDNQIHEYIVYELTVNVIGEGDVLINPDGILFLEDFIVQLTAYPDSGWDFAGYSGDASSNNNIITLTMDSDKEITALFINEIIINITKPEYNHFYFLNIGFNSDEYKPTIIGPITVKATAESEKGISRVEFRLNNDDDVKKVDDSEPYSWIWFLRPMGDEENFTIRVTAYDTDGNSNTDSITVYRPKFTPIRNHPLLTIGGLIGLISLILLRNQGVEPDRIIPDDNDTYDLNRPPVIDAGGPYTGIVGIPVNFDASGTYDPDGDFLTYSWIFGDGSIGSGVKLSHTYNTPGKYTIKLTVTDSEGNSDTETIEITITDGSQPIQEDELFWYIVSALALVITVAVGLLYVGGKLYV
jgi:PKD repeat protein